MISSIRIKESSRDYCSLHNHTHYSNLHVTDSTNRPEQLIDYAWEIGLSGLAFTDHDCLSGTVQFIHSYEKKLEAEWDKLHPDQMDSKPSYEEMSKELDFKVLIGNEIYLGEEGLNETKYRADGGHFYHYLLIAKDREGYEQLKRLSSAAWQHGWYRAVMRTPTWPSDLFREVKGGHLICSTACLGGYAARMVLQGLTEKNQAYLDKLDQHLSMMEQLFGVGNFFIELQPNGDMKSDQVVFNKYMLEKYWGKYPFIFTTDSHYLNPSLREIHKNFLQSRSSKSRDIDEFYEFAYMMSQQEVRDLMSYVTDEQFMSMVTNSQRIRNMCSYYSLTRKQVVPHVVYEHYDEYEKDLEIFSDVVQELYPNFYYYLHTTDKADNYLARLIAHGYKSKKDHDKWNKEVYYKRLEEELWTIKEVGEKIDQHMSDYFITMSKMIDIIWNKAGSIVGPSRGSAGAMLINYLLGITQMNPIQLDLPYVWRFMHPSRPDLPDIDFDTESEKRANVFNEIRDYFRSIGGDVINVCTFGTEGTKSAIKTAARGLGIDDDLVSYINSMIPNERGFDWSLHDCYYGNDEDRKPITAFKTVMDQNPLLWQLSQNIEGLITRLGVHASGIVCTNGDINEFCSIMKTNSEQLVTALDLHTLESCGGLKYDALTVSALDRIHQAMNYMLEDGMMEWQGSLKATYDKYLSPEVLDYTDPQMWSLAGEGKISSLFQFDTSVGSQAIKAIQPTSLTQLAIANSVMRLMSGDGEQPLETYAKYKSVPQLWYDEMDRYGLTANEVSVLEKYLKVKDGVGDSQEVIMRLVMDSQISNFDMSEANRLRKTVAKKAFREIEAVKELFYEKGNAQHTSKALLDYVWNVQIARQLGYSFSEIHTTGYSLIALQEMNLAAHYPILYWNCACLSVDSSAINPADFYNLVKRGIIVVDDAVEGKKIQNKMNYAKLASALDKFKETCDIHLPDINLSRLSFTPDIHNNSILYGLKGITRITAPVIEEIMAHRPYTSLNDFLNKITKRIITKDKVVNLIKSGAFDRIEGKNKEEILKEYISSIADTKNKLTLSNANKLIDEGLMVEPAYEVALYKLTKELKKHKSADKLWYAADEIVANMDTIKQWRSIIQDSNIKPVRMTLPGVEKEHAYLSVDSWKYFYDRHMDVLRSIINTQQQTLLHNLNTKIIANEYNKYCNSSQNDWELESLNFYFTKHPLSRIAPQIESKTNIREIHNVSDIVEGAQDGQFFIKGKIIPKMKLYTIIGTVIDRDRTKSTVTLQCPDGVVTVKVYKDLFSTFMQVIGTTDELSGEKNIEQDSFFEKGTHLLITGIQRGVTFIPKVYKNTGHKAILKIVLDKDQNFDYLEEKRDE